MKVSGFLEVPIVDADQTASQKTSLDSLVRSSGRYKGG